MTAFDLYAAYYDLLYRDKDYGAEAHYVAEIVREAVPTAKKLLEIGSGTGAHAVQLARLGFDVLGIDMSTTMVDRARDRLVAAGPPASSQIRLDIGDARSYRAGRTFDGVISLFHVMSYQVTNEDQERAFATARAHLDAGGVFVFDFWYGPAVLTDRPKHVTKNVANEKVSVNRITTPVVDVNHNRVDVSFHVDILSRVNGETGQIVETHRMRYLFIPEIEERLQRNGFDLVAAWKWMTRSVPDDRSWYVCVVARAR